jgi:catechol 2,3-dioxygenase-like lactoylglutathione lyase family enzyme
VSPQIFCRTKNEARKRRVIFTVLALLLGCSSMRAQLPDLAGIAHVAFRVSDVSKARDFYGSLGYEQSFEFADAGKPPVSYIKVNDHQFIELYGGASDSQRVGLMHVCYEAADIQVLWSEYTKRGLNPPESKKARAGNLLFTFRDPENELLEYTQYLAGSLHSEDRGKHLGAHRVSEALVQASIPVKDIPLERDFYTKKLGFAAVNSRDGVRLRLPGNSGQEVTLEVVAPDAKSSITFSVGDLRIAERELRSSGLKPERKHGSLAVTDPDGVVIEFALPERKSSGNH